MQQQQSNTIKPQAIGGVRNALNGLAKASTYKLPTSTKNAYWTKSGGKARANLKRMNQNDSQAKSLKSKKPFRKSQPTLHQVQKSIARTMGKTQ